MNLIRTITGRQFDPRAGRDKPVPKAGMNRFIYLNYSYFWKLIRVNLLFLLCCIPVITIPAAICALNRYLIKMVRTGYGFDLSDFWKEFRQQLIKSLPFGVFCGVLIFYAYYLFSYAPDMAGCSKSVFTKIIAFFSLSAASLIGTYTFILLPMLSLKSKNILKNALILIICEKKTSITILLITFFMGFLIEKLFPYSIFLLLINWFSITQLMLCSIINPVVNKRIIDPYMTQKKDEYCDTKDNDNKNA